MNFFYSCLFLMQETRHSDPERKHDRSKNSYTTASEIPVRLNHQLLKMQGLTSFKPVNTVYLVVFGGNGT